MVPYLHVLVYGNLSPHLQYRTASSNHHFFCLLAGQYHHWLERHQATHCQNGQGCFRKSEFSTKQCLFQTKSIWNRHRSNYKVIENGNHHKWILHIQTILYSNAARSFYDFQLVSNGGSDSGHKPCQGFTWVLDLPCLQKPRWQRSCVPSWRNFEFPTVYEHWGFRSHDNSSYSCDNRHSGSYNIILLCQIRWEEIKNTAI